MTTIKINVPSVPVPQPRPRASTFGGHLRVHEPTTVKQSDGTRKPHQIVAFKATVRLAAQQQYQGPPLTGPLRVDLVFVLPRHSNMFWKKKPTPRYWATEKPDRDNLDKAVMDALKGLTWLDDCQVCDGRIRKVRAAGDEPPHVEIEIRQLDDYVTESSPFLENGVLPPETIAEQFELFRSGVISP